MPILTPEATRRLASVAQRHGVSPDAATIVLDALISGGGAMAQFSHPELGGPGQWLRGGLRGGMVMVGDAFNDGLRQRVGALCADLAAQLAELAPASIASAPAASDWWPASLGAPSSSGAQDGFRYACFPNARRLAIQREGRLELYDTGDHRVVGVAMRQGGGAPSAAFLSDKGQVRLADLAPARP